MTSESRSTSLPSPTCYFSISIDRISSTHSTPTTTPFSPDSPECFPESTNSLLSHRELPSEVYMSSARDVSSLLQLQTAAAHRPAAQPLQHSSSNSSNSNSSNSDSNSSNSNSNSSNSSISLRKSSTSSTASMSSSTHCCSRCRRESLTGTIQFGTNIYYCSHCARMTGYCAG